MSESLRVCHIVPSLEDRHGGPSRSVRKLAAAMHAAGAAVELLTTREPGQPMAPATPEDAPVHVFPRTRPLSLCRSPDLRAQLADQPADCLHHHSLWLLTLRYAAHASRQRDIPLVISPRGMLSPWAYRHRRWKKWLAERLVHPGAFRNAAGWHATSEEEAADIRQLGFTKPVCVAPNGVDLPDAAALERDRAAWEQDLPGLSGRRVALFYSRFHRKKRLRELIGLWAARQRGDWFLLIAGVPEEYSVAEVRGWLDAAGLRENAAVLAGAGRPAPYALASLFLLPSHSENFGLVIAEALAAGVPALVTDATPWGALESHGAGRCVRWEDYPTALGQCLSLDDTQLGGMGAHGRAWMGRDFCWSAVAASLLSFYRGLPRA